MPRVRTYEGGNIQSQGTTGARFRAADFGPSALGEGLQKLGQVGAEAVDRIDQVEDVKARVEANRLAVEHSEHVREINRRVKETLGEGAEAAADQGIADLETVTKEIVTRASPRAKMLLQSELTNRSGAVIDAWQQHGFSQKGEALETSSVARIGRIVEDASDIDDEDQAKAMLGEIRGINERRAQFFGKGKDWLIAEDTKAVSTFYKSRAMKLAGGESGSASAAIGYAEKNRDMLTDDDYMAILNGYNDSAMEEAATAMVYGANPVGAAVEADPAPEDGEPPAAVLDPVAFFKGWMTSPVAEGKALAIDNNGAQVKFGFNQAYNKDIDVAKLDIDTAAQRFASNHWKRSGADKLPPALAAVHMDTFFLNEKQAGKILRESGGDVDKYFELRRAFLNGLAAKNPAKYPGDVWERRTKALEDYTARLGGNGRPLPVAATTSLENLRTAVMQRTDIGMNLKRRIIRIAEQRRSEVRQEQQIAEEEMDNQLTETVVGLGENFTSVKQLPQDVYLNAPPKMRQKYVAMANANKETKPLKPEVAAQIGFLRTFRPQSLAEPAVQRELASKGVSPKMLSTLAEEAGRAQGILAGAKPDLVSRSALESLARPAFEAAGHRLWTTEEKKDENKTAVEQRADAARQIQLLNYLETEAVAWSQANPGKQADTQTMQKWIGSALIRTLPDRPFGTLNDQEVINTYGRANYDEIFNKLRQAGIPPTQANVAQYLRRHFQRTHGGL